MKRGAKRNSDGKAHKSCSFCGALVSNTRTCREETDFAFKSLCQSCRELRDDSSPSPSLCNVIVGTLSNHTPMTTHMQSRKRIRNSVAFMHSSPSHAGRRHPESSSHRVAASSIHSGTQIPQRNTSNVSDSRSATHTSHNSPPSNNSNCAVCLTRPTTHIFPSCFHKCVCRSCAERISLQSDNSTVRCPICRVAGAPPGQVMDT